MLHILCYHRVLDKPDESNWPYFIRGTAVTAEVFEHHMQSLSTHTEVLDEEGVISWLRGERVLERPASWVTFDDGYRDNLTVAAPITARYGINPTLFITTNTLQPDWSLPVDGWYGTFTRATKRQGVFEGLGTTPWSFDLDDQRTQQRLTDGPEKRAFVRADAQQQASMLAQLSAIFCPAKEEHNDYLDKQDLEALEEMGWLIGAHSLTHISLPSADTTKQREEVLGSLEAVRSLGLQRCSSFFAYPDGAHNEALVMRMRRWCSGLHGALTVEAAPTTQTSPSYAMPRYIPPNDQNWMQTLWSTTSSTPKHWTP